MSRHGLEHAAVLPFTVIYTFVDDFLNFLFNPFSIVDDVMLYFHNIN